MNHKGWDEERQIKNILERRNRMIEACDQKGKETKQLKYPSTGYVFSTLHSVL